MKSAEVLADRQTTDDVNSVMKALVYLVDTVTTPLLLKLMQAGKLSPARLVTHRFDLGEIMQAYDTFSDAAKMSALKVVLKGAPEPTGSSEGNR